MKRITVAETKLIRETLGATHVVIFAVAPDGTLHVATHGESRKDAKEAADAGNRLKTVLEFPRDACRTSPLPRECANCVYFKPDYGMWCFNGWSGDGSKGHCHAMPQRVNVAKDNTCSQFEPNA